VNTKGQVTKEKIIREGAQLIHRNGYNNTGIKEILDAVEIPKGSFYFYFKSKEDFGIHIIEYYTEFIINGAKVLLGDESQNPLQRLQQYFSTLIKMCEKINFQRGCPIGNMILELSDINDIIRKKLMISYEAIVSVVESNIRQCSEAGYIPHEEKAENLATFIFNSWEGALLNMKLSRSAEPLHIFYDMLFKYIIMEKQI